MELTRSLTVLSLAALMLAGCTGTPPEPEPQPNLQQHPTPYIPLVSVNIANTMAFTQSVVTPAQGIALDLYEPTMEVSDTGTLYVAGHVIGVATTGTPAYYSNDDGATWQQLPFLGPVSLPSPIQGAQPPPGDEGFIVAGDNGQAWMADIYAVGFSVSGWCGNGAELCYDNRQAYDRTATVTSDCQPVISLNDRPWAAYANGTLLLVNNPGTGTVQIGVMPAPPATPVGSADPVTGPTWNVCAGETSFIPGIPALRDDGLFAVPALTGDGNTQAMSVVLGNVADIFTTRQVEVFRVGTTSQGTVNFGQATFDADGTLFVGAYNNTRLDGKEQGRFILATSTDGGETFVDTTFVTGAPVQSLYIDGNMAGEGAMVVWSQAAANGADWYVAHAFVGPNGEPVLRDATLAVAGGPPYSAHVMGAASGPDGRSYFLNFVDADLVSYVGTTPISVWIQSSGPTLPVRLEAELPAVDA